MTRLALKRMVWIAAIAVAAGALGQSAQAQTNLYWQGGAGTWSASGGTWHTVPGGNYNGGVGSGDSSQGWDNSGNSAAVIGALTGSGSGGFWGTTSITQYGKPTVINLDPSVAINASQVTFTTNSITLSGTGAYALNGGTLNTSNIALDLSTTASPQNSFRATINSNIATGGTLNFSTLQFANSGTSTGILMLGGSNSFNTLNIGGITNGQAASAISSAFWVGVVITNSSAFTPGANVVLGNNGEIASLCPNGQNITLGSVQIVNTVAGPYLHSSTYGVYSTTGIARIGAGSFTDVPHSSPSITINGAISGAADVVFGSGSGNDGRGVYVLNAQSSYSGDTFFQQSANRFAGDPDGMSIVTIGTDNALPVTTSVIFGRFGSAGNSGALDVNGHTQTVRSIGSMLSAAGVTTNDYCGGITSFNPSTGGTLGLLDDMGRPAGYYDTGKVRFIESQFHGVIGKTLLDATSRATDSAASQDNITLHLLTGTSNSGDFPGFNGLSLTLGLGGSNAAPPAYPVSQSNTYNGGTIIDGGALWAANGRVFSTTDTATIKRNSATGTGPVAVNSGGTLGGSVAGGAIGMPSTGPVTVNSGGYLLPGGGFFIGANGLGNGGYGSGSAIPTFTPKANLPLNVLGDLTLNSGANVNFNFDATRSDLVNIGGGLNLAGTVTVNLNAIGGTANVASGTPIFEYGGSLTGGTANLSLGASSSVPGTTFQQVGNEIDIVVPGGVQLQRWNGNLGSSWNLASANFKYLGSGSTYADGNTVWFDDTATSAGIVNITPASVSPGRVAFLAANDSYTITGGSIVGSGAVLVAGGGTVTFANSNTYSGGTTIQNRSTLVLNNPAALANAGGITIQDASMLSLNYTNTASSSATYSGAINFASGGLGTGATPTLNVPAGQTAIFNGSFTTDGANAVAMTKTGSGTLVLANTAVTLSSGGTIAGMSNINEGLVRLDAVGRITTGSGSAQIGANISQLGQGPITVGRTGNGGGLWLDNIFLGATVNSAPSLGFVDVYSGGTLGATGKSIWGSRTNVALVLNTVDPTRPAGSFTLATVSKTDSLALQASFQQFDNNSSFNNNANCSLSATSGTITSANVTYSPAMTVNVTGSGTVMLQAGETTTFNTFGGLWSVNGGILQVGPFVQSLTFANTDALTKYSGATGEAMNALGFGTPTNQDFRANGGFSGNPDVPNPVTVNTGGMLAVAVDQLNAVPNNIPAPRNPTPPYVRSGVTLNNGAAVAATGYEVTFFKSGGTAQAIAISGSNNAVTARLGGDFTVASGGTGSVLTYDPNGQAKDYNGATIGSDNQARTVELVGGTRTLSNTGGGFSGATTISYLTNWNGTLLVASNGTIGGAFNIKRSGGSVSVAPGAQIAVQPYSTVNISDDNSSVLVSSTAANSTYGLMVAPSSGPTSLPVLNNVLSAGGNSVAIANNGTFNVNNGLQTVGAITGSGAFNVTGTATATAPSIVQNGASVAPGATLNLSGPGAVAASLALANSGSLNVTGGSHTVGTVGNLTLDGSGFQTLPTAGDTTVSGGAKLSAGHIYQNSLTINQGGAVALTAPNFNNTPYLSAVSSLSLAGSSGAWTSNLDVGQNGILIPSGNTAQVFSQIKQGAGTTTNVGGLSVRQWNGTNGIGSSAAAANPSTRAVGYADLGNGQTEIAYTVAGDAFLSGIVTGAEDRPTVSGTNLFTTNRGWSGGDFNYDTHTDGFDRAIELHNEGGALGAFGPIVGGAKPGDPNVPLLLYNHDNGQLVLINSGSFALANLDTFGINLADSTTVSDQNGVIDWLYHTFSAPDGSMQWAQSSAGGSDVLPAGSYDLGTLPTGLGNSAFGNGNGGIGNTDGSVFFIDTHGNTITTSVAVVPEPSSLALCGTGIAVALAVWRKRRNRSVRGDQFNC